MVDHFFKVYTLWGRNLGGDDKMDTAELTKKIFLAITHKIAEKGSGILPDQLLGTMTKTLGDVSEASKAAMEKSKEAIDAGAGAVERLKGLFEKK